MTETLGFVTKPSLKQKTADRMAVPTLDRGVNTRISLWPTRWPAIAKQECIDEVESAPADTQREVKYNLPCQDCELNAACLNAKQKELGSLLYDREILTNPRSSQSSLFPGTLLAPMLRPDMPLVPYWHKPFSIEHHFRVVQAWDIAWSEKIGGDYLVCMTGMIDLRDGQRQLLDIERWQGKSFDTQVKMIESKWKTYQSDMVVIESDVSQVIWSQHVGRNTSVPVKAHAAGGEKQDLAVGVPSILIKFENRKWVFPYQVGTQRHEEVVNFLGELEAFGWVDGKLQGIGEHDDTVMAFWHLDWGLDQFALAGGGIGELRRGNVPGARA